ncbi:MAG: lactonase family protein, partial [Marinilabiliales bacterium]|nr:lactonase family protein [Marinilabiliales bacterium]
MKKSPLLLMAMFFCNAAFSQVEEPSTIDHFYVGTYTDSGSEGIYRFGLDRSTGKLHSNGLAAMSENPSFLALTANGRNLLSVRETQDEKNQRAGYIELFHVDEKGNLTSVNMVSSGGAHPCHVSVNPEGWVIASNYTGGNVTLMQLAPTGELTEVLSSVAHTGSGPVRERQEKPHVHSSIFEPLGSRLFVADLGIDRVKVYILDKA